jgi:diphthamide synthase (EF-2-diphthine--ammonia ligase)
MSNKFIVMLSGGKDSLACYLKLVEDHGKSNVIPISLSYFYKGNKDRDTAISNHLTKLTQSIGVKIIYGNDKDFSDILDGLFNELDATQYYLCTGEIDHYGEIALYYEIINKYKLKGLYNPFIGKPKHELFCTLKRYNAEFAILSAFINKNNLSLQNQVLDYIGKRLTVDELEEIYINKPELYFSLQTIVLKYDHGYSFSEKELSDVISVISNNKSFEII